MSPKKVPVKDYLTEITKQKIIPNFFTSIAYLTLQEIECFKNENFIWLQDQEYIIAPPLNISPYPLSAPNLITAFGHKKIWSDFDLK